MGGLWKLVRGLSLLKFAGSLMVGALGGVSASSVSGPICAIGVSGEVSGVLCVSPR